MRVSRRIPSQEEIAPLFARLASGDGEALAAIYDAAASWLLEYLIVLTGSREDAEDCLHEVFLRLVRYRRPQVKDDENAARYYEAAFHLVRKPTDKERSAVSAFFRRANRPDLGARMPEQILKSSSEYIGENEDALFLLHKAADFPLCRFRVDWNGQKTSLHHLAKIQDVTRVLILESLLAAPEGDWKRAVSSCREAMKVGRAVGKEPLVISQLVRMRACRLTLKYGLERILASGAIPIALLDGIETAIALEDKDFEFQIARQGERAIRIEMINQVCSGQMGSKELSEIQEYWTYNRCWRFNSTTFWLFDASGLLEFDAARCLRMMNQLIEFQRLPIRERWRPFKEWDQQIRKLRGKHRILTTTLLPDSAVFLEKEMAYHALLRSAQAALAFEKYRHKNGRFPLKLSEALPPGADLPIDPFTGNPLRVVRTETGVVIYSIGADEQDEGGMIEVNRKTWQHEDVGFRLLNPDVRGRP